MTLYSYATAIIGLAINCVGGKLLPRFEGTILILHILGFFAILIPLTYMAEHKSAKEVFTHFLNEGQWPSQGLSFFIGLIGPVFAFAGGDAAVHVCRNRSKSLLNELWKDHFSSTMANQDANVLLFRWQKRFPTLLFTCLGL
jgi:amino acid transporter